MTVVLLFHCLAGASDMSHQVGCPVSDGLCGGTVTCCQVDGVLLRGTPGLDSGSVDLF